MFRKGAAGRARLFVFHGLKKVWNSQNPEKLTKTVSVSDQKQKEEAYETGIFIRHRRRAS